MPAPSAAPDDDSIFVSAKALKCRKCDRRRAVRCAISGLAGELLQPCIDPCGGHLREQGDYLFSVGLARYRALYEAARAAKAVA